MCPRGTATHEWRSEAIAASWHVDDIARTLGAIAESLAQCRDVEAKATLVHIHISPNALDQFPLVDDFAGMLGKHYENVERAPSDVKRRAIPLQRP
jgi:hypothetical protein